LLWLSRLNGQRLTIGKLLSVDEQAMGSYIDIETLYHGRGIPPWGPRGQFMYFLHEKSPENVRVNDLKKVLRKCGRGNGNKFQGK